MPQQSDLFMFTDPFDPDTDWLEQTPLQSPSRMNIGRKKSQNYVRGYIPFAKFPVAVQFFLGYSYIDLDPFAAGVQRLFRSMPAQHPFLDQQMATEIADVVLLSWTGRRLRVTPEITADRLDFAEWKWALTTVGYSQAPIDVFPDTESWTLGGELVGSNPNYPSGNPAGETCRFANLVTIGEVDPLVINQGQYVVDFPHDATKDGRPYIAPSHFLRNYTTKYQLTLYNYPYEWFYNDNGQYTNIGNCIGRINKYEFFPKWPNISKGVPVPGRGLAPHTCLLDKVYPKDQDVYGDPAVSITAGALQRRVDMVFEFTHFDPPNAIPDIPANRPQSQERGWRLHPYGDMKFYPSRKKTPDDTDVLPEEADFDKMFAFRDDI